MQPDRAWKRMWLFALVGLVLVAGLLVGLVVLHLVELTLAATYVLLVGAAGFFMYLRQRSSVQRRPDERLRRIGYRASWFAWQITAFGIVGFWVLDYFHLISLGMNWILMILMIGTYVSFMVSFWVLRAVGDAAE